MLLGSSVCLTICRPPVCLWIRSLLDSETSRARCQHRHNTTGRSDALSCFCLCHTSTSSCQMACSRALVVKVHLMWWRLELVGALRVRCSAASALHLVSASRLAPVPRRVKPRMQCQQRMYSVSFITGKQYLPVWA